MSRLAASAGERMMGRSASGDLTAHRPNSSAALICAAFTSPILFTWRSSCVVARDSPRSPSVSANNSSANCRTLSLPCPVPMTMANNPSLTAPALQPDTIARAAVPQQANHIGGDRFCFPACNLTDVPFVGLIYGAAIWLNELSRGADIKKVAGQGTEDPAPINSPVYPHLVRTTSLASYTGDV